MLDEFHGSFHWLDLGKRLILFSIALRNKVIHAELVCEIRVVAVDVLVGLVLD